MQTDPQSNENAWASFSHEDLKVFSVLVPDGEKFDFERLSGMLAYVLYTLQKHQFIVNVLETERTLPKDNEIRTIVKSFQNENSYLIENLKQQSQIILSRVVEEHANQIVQDKFIGPAEKMVKDNLGSLEKTIKGSTNFWISVRASILASFFYSLLIATAIFIATSALPDTKFARIVRILFETEKTESTQ